MKESWAALLRRRKWGGRDARDGMDVGEGSDTQLRYEILSLADVLKVNTSIPALYFASFALGIYYIH
jgi:hypothetical protein